MMSADYSRIPESALIALATLILKRTRLCLLVTNREQAISVIRGVKPAPPRNWKGEYRDARETAATFHSPR
jgi:hypothetical protein